MRSFPHVRSAIIHRVACCCDRHNALGQLRMEFAPLPSLSSCFDGLATVVSALSSCLHCSDTCPRPRKRLLIETPLTLGISYSCPSRLGGATLLQLALLKENCLKCPI